MTSLVPIGLHHFTVLSAILFGLGFLTVLTRKNAVAILMGVELLFNAAALNFVAFSRYVEGSVGGQVFTLFIIVLAAAEAAVALAIVLSIYRQFHSIDSQDTSTLRS
jgi:NADH-quinone oxidoreductase subunit K